MKRTTLFAILATTCSVLSVHTVFAAEGKGFAGPHAGAGWVQGSTSPERIPEWVALTSTLSTAEGLEAKKVGDGLRYLNLAVGLTSEGAQALLTYTKAAKAFGESTRGPGMRQDLCAKRAELTSSKKLALEVERRGNAGEQRARLRAEGSYSVLSAEDAAKLRNHALNMRATLVVYQVTDYRAAFSNVDPRRFLASLCGQ
jgi:hypothetical protein